MGTHPESILMNVTLTDYKRATHIVIYVPSIFSE